MAASSYDVFVGGVYAYIIHARPFEPSIKSHFWKISSIFGDKCPRNGSKNDTMVPRTTLECPHEGLRVVTMSAKRQVRAEVLANMVKPGTMDISKVRTLHPAPKTPHPHLTPYTQHPTPSPYTLHPTPHTLHPKLYILQPTPYSQHPAPYTSHPTPYTRQHGCLQGHTPTPKPSFAVLGCSERNQVEGILEEDS